MKLQQFFIFNILVIVIMVFIGDDAYAVTPATQAKQTVGVGAKDKGNNKKGGVCRADRKAHCPGVEGRPARRACLLKHIDSLSPGCKSFIESVSKDGKPGAAKAIAPKPPTKK